MKFTCETKKFLDVVLLAKQFIIKGSLSVLSCIYIEINDNRLIIRFNNLKSGGETFFNVEEGENGKALLRIEKLDSVLKNINDEYVICYIKDKKFYIKNTKGTASFKMSILEEDISKFPILPEIKEDYCLEIKQKKLVELINKTFFILVKDYEFFSNGSFFELRNNKIIMTATDGKRLSTIFLDKDIKEGKNVVIPYDIMSVIKNYLTNDNEVKLFIDDKFIFIKIDDVNFYSTLLDIDFPNYKKVIPESIEYEIIVNRLKLKKAIESVSLMVNEAKELFLFVSKNNIILKSNNSILGEAENIIDCEYNGKDCKIVVNCEYLKDPLFVMEEEFVVIGFNNPEKVLLVKEKNNDKYINVIVPFKEDKKDKNE